MTGVAALLAEVEAAGARLRVEGGRLVATGARLPGPLVERLLASKAGLLAVLAPPGNVGARPTTVDPTRCRYCGGRMPDLRVKPPATPEPAGVARRGRRGAGRGGVRRRERCPRALLRGRRAAEGREHAPRIRHEISQRPASP